MAVPLERAKKWGPCLGTRAPSSAFPFVGVVFTPTRGVIHPSFPLRGRWERTLKSGEQAPSPSLTTLLDSSSETRTRLATMHERSQPSRLNKSNSFFYLASRHPRSCRTKSGPKFTLEPCQPLKTGERGRLSRTARSSEVTPGEEQ